jgi:hypothetical protein
MLRRAATLVIVSWVSLGLGCATAAKSAAVRGDDATLRAALERGHRAGTIDDAEAADLAHAVASRDLSRATAAEAMVRVRDLRACARDVDDALEARAKVHDAAGAEAALALVDAGVWEADDVRRWLGDTSDAWRAVGTRSLVRAEDGAARQKAMLDPVPAVRRAALRASHDARDPSDLDALFDVARRDPEPLAKNDAVRAIAAVADVKSAALVVTRLGDLWNTPDDAIREDIAVAYGMPVLAAAGGAEALRVLVASGHGPGAIAGAAAVVRAPTSGDGARFDPQTRASAVGLLVRTIESGSRRDTAFAVAVIPTSDPRALEALRRAIDPTHDLELRLAALSRLTESPPDRAAALTALESFGSPKTDVKLASRARLALAAAGDLRVQAWIEQDLTSEDPSLRLLAASALSSLGRASRGAPLLVDKDPRVRARVACTLLLARRAVR